MVKEAFRNWQPNDDTRLLLDGIVGIVEEYWSQGIAMTVRQVHYQCVSRHVKMVYVPPKNRRHKQVIVFENTPQNYAMVSRLLSLAREAGMVDWRAIVDRVRSQSMNAEFEDLGGLVQSAEKAYRLPRWKDQKVYIEVVSEKDALSSSFKPTCEKLHVRLVIDRGFGSTTAVHDMAMRFRQKSKEGYKCVLIYFGDHDPSGLNMPKDIKLRFIRYGLNAVGLEDEEDISDEAKLYKEKDKRLEFLVGQRLRRMMELQGVDSVEKLKPEMRMAAEAHAQVTLDEDPEVQLVRIGLTKRQVDQYNPPPNKLNPDDSREPKYNERYGSESWELDALPPEVLSDLLENAIKQHLDEDKYRKWLKKEEQDKKKLRKIARKGGLVLKDAD
jgi:hypothetical protein